MKMNVLICTNGTAWANRALEVGKQIALAAARATAVRDYIIEEFPRIKPFRLGARGIGSKERIKAGRKVYLLDDSTTFITTRK